jgi:hypothetical protein
MHVHADELQCDPFMDNANLDDRMREIMELIEQVQKRLPVVERDYPTLD